MLEFGRRRLRQWDALEVVNGGEEARGKEVIGDGGSTA